MENTAVLPQTVHLWALAHLQYSGTQDWSTKAKPTWLMVFADAEHRAVPQRAHKRVG